MNATAPTKSSVKSVRKQPKQQRAILLVETILEAAAHILEDGIEPFTTNHIAQKAGVSIGSLYQYFPGADAIMAALIEKHVADERAAARNVVATISTRNSDVMRDLIAGYVNAHANAPRLSAQLHALAPAFGLQGFLANARDEQADEIALALALPPTQVRIAVMAIEGVVLATLVSDPAQLQSQLFVDQLNKIAIALLSN
ncbi:MAG: TetR/AcrR family transcriptional regulator [Devosiaceae bacterium]|nr:TetR/AcrR family transcriptional regulator [Devosiaceae bacterium]